MYLYKQFDSWKYVLNQMPLLYNNSNNILRSFKALCLITQWMLLDCYSKYVNIKNQLVKMKTFRILELWRISNWCICLSLVFQWKVFLLILDKSISFQIRRSGFSFENCTSKNNFQCKFWDWKHKIKNFCSFCLSFST